MTERGLFGRLARDRRAATGILVGAAMPAVIGAAAMAIDLGSIYLAQRQLQGIADAAAMSATEGDIIDGGMERAQAVIDETGVSGVSIETLTPGEYHRDPTIAYTERFEETASEPTAARIELRRDVPLFFGKIFTPDLSIVRARAVSQRTDLAAYSLGSRLAGLNGGLGNAILSRLAGTELGLSAMDVNGLASAQVDVLGFAEALKVRIGATGATYGEVFDQEVSLGDAVEAMADALGSGSSAQALRDLAAQLGAQDVKLSGIIDLGPLANSDVSSGASGVTIDAYTLLRAMLQQGKADDYVLDVDLSILGLASTTAKVVGGSGWQSSPLLTITAAQDYVLHTSQARILIQQDVGAAWLGLLKLRVPVYAELAEAEARLSDIRCGGDEDEEGVDLSVTPSVGEIAIAQPDMGAFPNLNRDVALSPARLVTLPLAHVSGFAQLDLGGASPQVVHFTPDEAEARTVKTVATNDLASALVASLASKLQVTVKALGLGVNAGNLTTNTANTVKLAAPSLDLALTGLTQALGLHVGAADVRIDMLRCGVPQVVA